MQFYSLRFYQRRAAIVLSASKHCKGRKTFLLTLWLSYLHNCSAKTFCLFSRWLFLEKLFHFYCMKRGEVGKEHELWKYGLRVQLNCRPSATQSFQWYGLDFNAEPTDRRRDQWSESWPFFLPYIFEINGLVFAWLRQSAKSSYHQQISKSFGRQYWNRFEKLWNKRNSKWKNKREKGNIKSVKYIGSLSVNSRPWIEILTQLCLVSLAEHLTSFLASFVSEKGRLKVHLSQMQRMGCSIFLRDVKLNDKNALTKQQLKTWKQVLSSILLVTIEFGKHQLRNSYCFREEMSKSIAITFHRCCCKSSFKNRGIFQSWLSVDSRQRHFHVC